ncbi:hypothetical protein [Flavivirga algicola]|uniref:Uncharacterized protein n=1 Tax=Flavivirga algicola TaxID=2729136 RepID=A0ABX1RUY4_9FLAO|nr:hypothetical protein [Flavivirga algicola]NMH87359.1 hypothetical protein [Flavivirga algicola]
MEKLIGYTCIILGALIIFVVVILSKQQIGWSIIKASICLAVPILLLWVSFYMGFSLAESIIFDQPYQLFFLGILSLLVFLFSGFEMKHLPSFLVFLIGFMIIYFGLFMVLVIANMRIGF